MKQNAIQIHKNFGTYQLFVDVDGSRYYECRHLLSGQETEADTIKEAKESLDQLERDFQKVQAAVSLLKGLGYKVFKEVA